MLYVLYFTEYLDHCTHTSLKIFNPRHLHLGASFMFVFSCVRSTKLKLLEQVRVPSVQKKSTYRYRRTLLTRDATAAVV